LVSIGNPPCEGAFSAIIIKTNRKDARGIAQLLRIGPSEQPSEDQCRASHLSYEDDGLTLE